MADQHADDDNSHTTIEQALQQLYHICGDDDDKETSPPPPPPPRVLDARPRAAFLGRRLRGAVNVEAQQLLDGGRGCFLLPNKATPFAVVVCGTPGAAGELQAFLCGERGWRAGPFLCDSPQLWAAAARLGVLEEGLGGADGGGVDGGGGAAAAGCSCIGCCHRCGGGGGGGCGSGEEAADEGEASAAAAAAARLARRCLFSPSPVLAAEIAAIEAALAAQHAATEPPSGAAAGIDEQQKQQQQQQQQPRPGPRRLVLRALDVGCGSGRDLAWLACRETCVPVGGAGGLDGGASCCCVHVSWRVTGVDNLPGALGRACELATAMALPPGRVRLVLCDARPNGSLQLRPLPYSNSSSSSGSRLRAARAAGMIVAAADPDLADDDDATTADAARGAAAGVYDAAADGGPFDLVVCVRFLQRALMPVLAQLVRPKGGHVLFSHFQDGPGLRAFGRPSGAAHVLQPGELAGDFFGPRQGFEVLRDGVALEEHGRELSAFVARRR